MSDDGNVDSLPPQGPVERDTVHEEGVEEGNATPRVAGSVASTVLLEAESSIDEPPTSMSYQSTPWEGQTNESLQEILIESKTLFIALSLLTMLLCRGGDELETFGHTGSHSDGGKSGKTWRRLQGCLCHL